MTILAARWCGEADDVSEASCSTQCCDAEMSPEFAQRYYDVLETKRANAEELDAAARHGGDEMWEESADSDSDGDIATPDVSDDEDDHTRPLPLVPAWPAADAAAPMSKFIAVPLPTVRVRAVAATPHQLASQKLSWKRRNSTEVSSTQPRGLAALVGNLRGDNCRLLEALTSMERAAKESAEEAADRPRAGGVDFAHLLALVKELGDGLGSLGGEDFGEVSEPVTDGVRCGDGQPDAGGCGPIRFSMCTQAEEEAVNLRAALAESRRETTQLQAQLAKREAMLRSLRNPVCAA